MAEHVLYCFAQSGNAYKAALTLNRCGAAWAPRLVDFFNAGTRTPGYRALNEMGEVPVLEHGRLRLTQSGLILDYVAERPGHYGAQAGDQSGDERREILRWLLFDNHRLTAAIATLRFMLRVADTGETQGTKFLRGRAKAALRVLDGHLAGRDWVVAEHPTIADLSLCGYLLCGYLYWGEEFAEDWAEFPRIAAWLERIRSLPGWVHPYELMPGHPLPDAG